MSPYLRVEMVLALALSMGLTLWFTIGLGKPWRTRHTTGAWLWASMAWFAIALDVLLLLVLLRIAFPPWIALLVLLGQDAVYAWRLRVLYQARRQDKEAQGGR